MNMHVWGTCAMGPRQAFLNTLRDELAGLPPPLVEDMVADFERHFADALAAGRSERQAAVRLGDPVWLAGELRAETARVAA
jgi:uncharacterized membrane protein